MGFMLNPADFTGFERLHHLAPCSNTLFTAIVPSKLHGRGEEEGLASGLAVPGVVLGQRAVRRPLGVNSSPQMMQVAWESL